MTIKPLEEKDLNTVSLLMKEAFKSEPWIETWDCKACYTRLKTLFNIETSINYCLIEDNKICGLAIGFVLPFENIKEYTLMEFFIDTSLKGKHLGQSFLNLVIEELKKQDIKKIHFYTSGTLDKFYSKSGFKKVDDEYLMELDFD